MGDVVTLRTKSCPDCSAVFEVSWDRVRCLPCHRLYRQEWRAKRKAEGLPTRGKATLQRRREYNDERRKNPEVRRRAADQQRQYRNDPKLRPLHEARRMVQAEIKAGRMKRLPCEVCGDPKTDAHHDDYSKPLDVRFLCRTHHTDVHYPQSAPYRHAATGSAGE